MDSGIGTILRAARNRRKVDLSEVEASTRIRLRYLRAIEDEEWDVLPGGVYTRGFIRTYAGFLGLDGERLAEDYRQGVEGWRSPPDQQASTERRELRSGRKVLRSQRTPLTALSILLVLAVAALAVVAIPGQDGEGGEESALAPPSADDQSHQSQGRPAIQPSQRSSSVSVLLAASAEVWVCVLDGHGDPLVNGQILEAGAEEGPFHSGSFTVSFGNGGVSMRIDGREAEIPATPNPIGYSIDSSGALTELDEAERPTCT